MKTPLRHARSAFTLVEVILAILIISAIMGVLLYFYQRSIEVRQIVLQEAEFVSVSRMLMEQITGELRTARTLEDQSIGLEGSSNMITFICTTVPQTSRWITSTNEAIQLPPVTDLKKVSYRLLTNTNASRVLGVDRTEELMTGATFTAGTNATEFVSTTNSLSELDTNLAGINETLLIRPLLSDRVKFLQFRYWAGTNWVGSWNSLELPVGVEISLGADPMPTESQITSSAADSSVGAEAYPYEVFRRVIYLPHSVALANRIAPASEPLY